MAQRTEFEIGNIVKLKSGGPDMTVQRETITSAGRFYRCQWFAGKKLESGDFPPDSLDVVEPEAKSE